MWIPKLHRLGMSSVAPKIVLCGFQRWRETPARVEMVFESFCICGPVGTALPKAPLSCLSQGLSRNGYHRVWTVYCSFLERSVGNVRHFFWLLFLVNCTSRAARGGGGSFKNIKPIGKIRCCESEMSDQKHWLLVQLFNSLTISLTN